MPNISPGAIVYFDGKPIGVVVDFTVSNGENPWLEQVHLDLSIRMSGTYGCDVRAQKVDIETPDDSIAITANSEGFVSRLQKLRATFNRAKGDSEMRTLGILSGDLDPMQHGTMYVLEYQNQAQGYLPMIPTGEFRKVINVTGVRLKRGPLMISEQVANFDAEIVTPCEMEVR